MAALNRGLIRCYEAYRDAFFEDFNHFYPGLNAFQMGTIILDLGDSDAWFDVFDSDEEAKLYRDEIEKQVCALRYLTPSSVRVGLRRMNDNSPELIWGKVSAVDVLFLTDPKRARRVAQAYRDAIPLTHPFVWDAVRGQLALFSALGIQTELANTVITEMDALFGGAKKDKLTKSIHLVLFAGHRVDTLDRRELRFPPSEEEKAKALIKEELNGLRDNEHEVILLASAAPGADILAHEICVELGLTSIICLPMSPEAFGGSVFKYLDNWRTRYLNLLESRKHLELCKREGLPHWLKGSGTNSWERGNRWVMEMARTWGAERITLLVLWDGKEEGDGPGGTAHMVKLAEATGKIHIMRIDSTQLLK